MARPFPEPFQSLEEFVPGSIRHAWACAVTVEGNEKAEALIAFRLALLQPGSWPPDIGTGSGIAINEDCVRVTTLILEGDGVDDALSRLAQHDVPEQIRNILGRDISFPGDRSTSRWNVSEESSYGIDRPAMRVATRSSTQLSQILTPDQFARADSALRFRAQSVAGLHGLSKLMRLHTIGQFLSHQSSSPLIQVDACLPLFVSGHGYSMEHLGYSLSLQIGSAVPRSDVLLAVGEPFNKGYRADSDAWRPIGIANDQLGELTLALQSEELPKQIEWSLAYRRQLIAKGTWQARHDFGQLFGSSKDSQIVLPYSSWTLHENRRLGRAGAFGEVFEGDGPSGDTVAIKRLKAELTYEGQRELTAARELIRHNLPHIIPILDVGLYQGRAYIVMERATRNLDEFVTLGLPSEKEVGEILDSLAAALEEIGNRVHRDLKPANVLLHDNTWKVGDLGLIRNLEASTSTNTMKDWRTPEYAAPEQFRGGRVSKETDIYAIGCIAHFLLTSRPPFSGENLAEQHARASPPRLKVSDSLRIPIERCLAKSADARPSPQALRAMLKSSLLPLPADPIAAVAQKLKQRAELALMQQAAEHQRNLDRLQRTKNALDELVSIFKTWLSSLVDASGGQARITGGLDGRRLELGQAYILLRALSDEYRLLPLSGWDIEASAVMMCSFSSQGATRMRSCSLWFAQRPEEQDHQWFEVAFTPKATLSEDTFGPEDRGLWPKADAALAEQDPDWQLASDPLPITMSVEDPFFVRWRDVLARAALDEGST